MNTTAVAIDDAIGYLLRVRRYDIVVTFRNPVLRLDERLNNLFAIIFV
jgi:hypothetical protein